MNWKTQILPRLRPGPALGVSVAAVLLAFAVGIVMIALLGVPVGEAIGVQASRLRTVTNCSATRYN